MSTTKLIPQKQIDLLEDIIQSSTKQANKTFDRRDNCFQVSIRKLAEKSGHTYSSVQRLFKALMALGVIKQVEDIQGNTRHMVDPVVHYSHNWREYHFMKAMFELGSHEAALQWSEDCQRVGHIIDPETGEIMGKYDYKGMYEYREEYSIYDAVKPRFEQKAIDADLMPVGVTEVDSDWFEMIGGEPTEQQQTALKLASVGSRQFIKRFDVITRLLNGDSLAKVAKDVGISRQAVSEINNKYVKPYENKEAA